MSTSTLRRTLWTTLFLAAAGGTAWAVSPASFTQTTEADFTRGQMKNLVVSSQGELMLARPMEILLPNEAAPGAVSAVAFDGKAVYAASATEGRIFRVEGGKAQPVVELPSTLICSMLWTGKELLVGTGGKGAGIYIVDDKGQNRLLWSDPKAKYVWAMARDEKGNTYAATGAEACAFVIDPAGKGQMLYQAPAKLAKNLLSLAIGREGQVFAGSDMNGLVFEINPAAKTGRIILDADEKEVTALAVDAGGGVYAATSDVTKAGDGVIQPSQEKTGRSEAASATSAPAPAPAPVPVPGPTTKPKKDAQKDTAGEVRAASPMAPRIIRVVSAPKESGEAPTAAPAAPVPQPAGGNGVYYIRPDGLVNAVFRRPVTIQSMILHNGQLILGTGNSGKIYAVSTNGDEITLLLNTEAKQVTCLAASENAIVFGTSGKGSVGLLKSGLAKEGTFTSEVLDAKQMARWGKLKFLACTPEGARLTVSTRTGNVAEPDDATWSAWSAEQPMGSEYLAIASPAGRFMQYRLKFAGVKASPSLRQIQAVYQVSNLPPVVSGIKVAPSVRGKEAFTAPPAGPEEGSKPFRLVAIQAADQNNDKLQLTIAAREVGTEAWITIAEKLAEPRFAWDTRTTGDGTYELKVTASDLPSNPPESALEGTRVSEPFVVDNTAPVVKPLTVKVDGAKLSVSSSAADAGSQITSIQYSLDSASEWTSVLPAGGMCDDKKEDFSFEIKDLKPGAHRVAVKVEDSFGNVGYASASVTVAKPKE